MSRTAWSGSRVGTLNPHSSLTCSPGPPKSKQTTGLPDAIASTTTKPPPSRRLAKRKTSQERMLASRRSRGIQLSMRACFSIPNSWIRLSRRFSSGPSPTIVNSASGRLSAKIAKARKARSNPLSGTKRPADRTANFSLRACCCGEVSSRAEMPFTESSCTLWRHRTGTPSTASRLQARITRARCWLNTKKGSCRKTHCPNERRNSTRRLPRRKPLRNGLGIR